MANATITNPPVSIQLESSESTTVPSNETWKISAIVELTPPESGTFNNRITTSSMEVNGTRVRTSVSRSLGGGDARGPSSTQLGPFEMVVTGGDTIKGITASILLQGFVVDS